MDIVEKTTGAIMGLAVGDALGAPLEGAKAGTIKSAFRVVRDYVNPEDVLPREKIYKWRKPGLYTDDTQQALVLIDSLVQDRGAAPEKIAERFGSLARGAEFRFGIFRGTGGNFRRSITGIRQGVPWSESGIDTAGNGAAARVAPVALYYLNDLPAMVDAVIKTSLFTHRNPLGISAAAGVAYIVARSAALEEIEPGDRAALVRDAAEFCRSAELIIEDKYRIHLFEEYKAGLHLFSDALGELAGRIDSPFEKVRNWIIDNAAKKSSRPLTKASDGFALASVVYSIYLAMIHSGDFEEAVTAAINSGGDTDTVGAMAGAMSGALHGSGAIPERWLGGLANRKQIKARAEALASKKWLRARLEDFYEMEYGLTKREQDERLALMKKLGVEFPDRKDEQRRPEKKPLNREKFDGKKFKREKKKLERFMKGSDPGEGW